MGIEFYQLAAPTAAILVALITVAFNVFDRRRFYESEREKLRIELRKSIIQQTDYISRKFEICNMILEKLSSANRELIELEADLIEEDCRLAEGGRTKTETVRKIFEEIVSDLPQNQLLISEDLHRSLSRDLTMHLARAVRGVQQNEGGLQNVRELRSEIDRLKEKVRSEFDSALRN